MAIKASATITIFNVDDIAGTTRYYKLVASGSSAPSKPAENADPDSTWTKTEPSVDTSKVLYFVDQTLWSNGAKTYSEVSKSSSYEAAKEAYTKAQNAQNTAQSAQDDIDNLEIGGRNLVTNSINLSDFSMESSTYTTRTIANDYCIVNRLVNSNAVTIAYGIHKNIPVTAGEKYTVSFEVKEVSGKMNFSIGHDSSAWSGILNYQPLSVGQFTFTVTAQSNTTWFKLYISGNDGTIGGSVTISKIKLEKGNRATDWTPAPEDVDAAINSKISNVDVEYYLSTSATSLAGGSWQTTAPTWVDGKYMWSRTKTTDGAGNVTYSPSENGTCIAGAKGATGQTGATGTGISSITEEYYKSTSKTTQTGGSWQTTAPTWENGTYIWTRSKIVYTNPSSTKYTTPICDSSWEAANDAAKTATDYLKFNNGLIVAKDAANWESGKNVFIDDDSVDIRSGSRVLARYGDSIQMYNNVGTRVLTDIGGNGRSLSVYDSSNGRQIVDIGESKLFDTLFTEERFEEATSVSVSNGVITATANFNYTIQKGIFNFIIRSDAIKASLLVNLSDDVNVDKLTRSIVWKSNLKTWLEIDGTHYPATYLDEYGGAEQTIRGNLWIENTGDANGLGYPEPPFGIGTKSGEHIEVDCNEIMAKSDELTPSQLFLNQEGGDVSINNNWVRAVKFQKGAMLAKNTGRFIRDEDGNDIWLDIVDGLNDEGNTTFAYGNWLHDEGLTNIYGRQMNLVVRTLPIGVDVGTPDSKDTSKKIMLSKTASGYYGLVNPDGSDESYVRSPTQGIIPYASGGNATHGLTTKIGTETWPFYSGYFEYLYVTNWIKVGDTKVSLEGHSHAWSAITGKPSSFTPSSHRHTSVYNSDDVHYCIMAKETNYFFRPSTDNSKPYTYLGSASHKWKQLYAATATINTSDLNQKRDVEKLDDKYLQLFDLIEPYSYKTINGDRVHTGFIAQYVEDAMEQVGLTAEELGFLCKDAKCIEEEDEDGNVISKTPILDEDGNQIYEYGLRYSEYIAICVAKIKQQEKRINEQEKRIDELEAKLNALLEKG